MIVNFSDQKVIKGQKSIFLAGPTPRNDKVISWRKDALKKLEELGFDGVVYVPEHSTWITKCDYNNQVSWEKEALTNSTTIIFWIPRKLPDMPALTTNVEFGYWLHSNKVVYGRPEDSEKNRYLDWLYELDYGKKPFNDLTSLLKEGISMTEDRK